MIPKPEFARAMAVLLAGLGKTRKDDFPAETSEVWYGCLKDIPLKALESAILRYLSEAENNFLPAPGVIRRLADEQVNGVPEQAGEAWGRVRKAIKRYGHYQPEKAREALGELVWAAVEGIGWDVLCGCLSDEMGNMQARFRKTYEELAGRGVRRRALPESLRPKTIEAAVKNLSDTTRVLETE